VLLFDEVLANLKLPSFTIKMNNRKILSGIAEVSGETERLVDITVAIDKLDKIGEEGVVKELQEKGISATAIEKIRPLFSFSGTNEEKVAKMTDFLAQSELGLKGIEELQFVFDQVNALGLIKAELEFDITLARGLNYYTGAIFEVKANGVKMGSICGGGRYDDLTGLFGMKGMSGVGISFGADRIYDVLTELELFPKETDKGLTLLFANFGQSEQSVCMKYVHKLRANGVDCEIYPSSSKMQKQMKYANDRNVSYVALVGENELNAGTILLKNMGSGEQVEMNIDEVIVKLKK
jgi:histidyl-tRNA synthetase